MGLKSGLPLPADYDFVAADVHLVGLKRAGRRAGDVAPVKIVEPIVASAPNLVEIVAILDGATQVRAYG
jgi:hypothetical protein